MTQPTEAFRNGMSFHTSKAVDKLSKGKAGDTISREEMAAQIGRDCTPGSNGYGNVNSAINHCINKHRVTWAWVKASQVWKCLDDSEKITLADVRRQSASRHARRGIRVCHTVDESNLDDAEKHEFRCQAVLLASQAYYGGASAMKKLSDKKFVTKEVDHQRLLNAILE